MEGEDGERGVEGFLGGVAEGSPGSGGGSCFEEGARPFFEVGELVGVGWGVEFGDGAEDEDSGGDFGCRGSGLVVDGP